MKKHPIDSLFAQKLKEAEIKPREEAWDKLQSRMQQKKKHRIGGWWQQGPWLAAAGVCLLLVAGWLMWRSPASNGTDLAQHSAEINSTQKIVEKAPNQQTKVSKPTKTPIEDPATEQIAAVESRPQVIEKTVHKNTVNSASEFKQLAGTPQPTIAKINESPKAENQVMGNPSIKENTSNPINQDNRSMAQATPPVTVAPATKTVVLQLPEIKESAVAALVKDNNIKETELTSEGNTDDVEDNLLTKPRKSTRMAKVWKQLKNAKNGERVDWDEVGFNPNKMLAKATGKERTN